MTKYDDLPKRVQRVVDAGQSGQTLMKTHRQKRGGGAEIEFTLHPSGKLVNPDFAQQAVKAGFFLPQSDGLLGEESSQSFQYAEAK